MENIIAMVGALPPNNKHRIKLTNILITKLWDSLEHPPINFQGPQFYYRTPDGSYNVSPGCVKAHTGVKTTNIIVRMYIFQT